MASSLAIHMAMHIHDVSEATHCRITQDSLVHNLMDEGGLGTDTFTSELALHLAYAQDLEQSVQSEAPNF